MAGSNEFERLPHAAEELPARSTDATGFDDSGPGVAEGYNSSQITDFGFFPNAPTPPPNNGGPIFQMEVSAAAAPEPSTWALMLMGLAGLGLVAHRRRTGKPA